MLIFCVLDTDGFEDSHIRVPMSTQLTLKAIDILENKYQQNFKEIVRWNVMARQIDMPDFTTIKMNLSLPVIEPSLENINQNQALLSKQPYQYGPSKCSIQDVYSGHDPNSESSGLMGVVNHSFMPEDATPVDSVCSIAAERCEYVCFLSQALFSDFLLSLLYKLLHIPFKYERMPVLF